MLSVTMAGVALAGVVAVLVDYGPRSRDEGPAVTGHPTVQRAPVHVRSVTFGGSFRPSQEVGAGGALWLIGQNGPVSNSGDCRIGRLDPARLTVRTYPLSACGRNVTAGGGRLYLETERSRPDNSHPIQIETFSLADHSSTVLSPVAMTVFGSEIAHTQLAYADGWLWLYGYENHAEVVQLSPTTGAVVNSFTSGVPDIGGTEPLIAAGAGGVWLAGGPGGSSALARLWAPSFGLEWVLTQVPASSLSSTPATTTVEWLATVAGQLWAGEATGSGNPQTALVERIIVLGSPGAARGTVVLQNGSIDVLGRSPGEEYGQAAVTVGKEVFSAGPGESCGRQPIWRVDPSSLRTSVVTILHPPLDPCLGEGSFRSETTAGGALFVLDGSAGTVPAVLYRVQP